jgi:hypothetical protein
MYELKTRKINNDDAKKTGTRIERISYEVDKLEKMYQSVEQYVEGLENIIERRSSPLPFVRLKDKLQQEAQGKFAEQQNPNAQQREKLRSIEVDNFSKPFTEIKERWCHLMRIPANVRVQFEPRVEINEGQDYTIIDLSGGYQYLQFTPQAMQKFYAQFADSNNTVKATFYATNDDKPIATASVSPVLNADKQPNGLNNILFTFDAKESSQEKKEPPGRIDFKPAPSNHSPAGLSGFTTKAPEKNVLQKKVNTEKPELKMINKKLQVNKTPGIPETPEADPKSLEEWPLSVETDEYTALEYKNKFHNKRIWPPGEGPAKVWYDHVHQDTEEIENAMLKSAAESGGKVLTAKNTSLVSNYRQSR